jgi:hypothetical protein
LCGCGALNLHTTLEALETFAFLIQAGCLLWIKCGNRDSATQFNIEPVLNSVSMSVGVCWAGVYVYGVAVGEGLFWVAFLFWGL